MGFTYSMEVRKEIKKFIDSNELVKGWLDGTSGITLNPKNVDEHEEKVNGKDDVVLRQFKDLYDGAITKGPLKSEDLDSLNAIAAEIRERTEEYRTEKTNTDIDFKSKKNLLYYQMNTLVESACIKLSLESIKMQQEAQTAIYTEVAKEEADYKKGVDDLAEKVRTAEVPIYEQLRKFTLEDQLANEMSIYKDAQGSLDQMENIFKKEAEKAKKDIEKEIKPYQEQYEKAKAEREAASKDFICKSKKVESAQKRVAQEKDALDKVKSSQAEKASAKKNLTDQIEKLQMKLMEYDKQASELRDQHNKVSKFYNDTKIHRRNFLRISVNEATFGEIYTDEVINKIPADKSKFGEFYKINEYIEAKEAFKKFGEKNNLAGMEKELNGIEDAMKQTTVLIDTQKKRLRALDDAKLATTEYDNAVKELAEAEKELAASKEVLEERAKSEEHYHKELAPYAKKLDTVNKKIKQIEKTQYEVLKARYEANNKAANYTALREGIKSLDTKAQSIYAKHEKMKDENPAIDEALRAAKDRICNRVDNYFMQLNFLKGSHKNTPEFKKVEDGITALKQMIADNKTSADIKAKLAEIKQVTEAYVEAKNKQWRPNPSKLRTSRLNLAESIISYCDATDAELTELDTLQAQQTTVKGYVNEKTLSAPNKGAQSEQEYVNTVLAKVENKEREIAAKNAEKATENEQPKPEVKEMNNPAI